MRGRAKIRCARKSDAVHYLISFLSKLSYGLGFYDDLNFFLNALAAANFKVSR